MKLSNVNLWAVVATLTAMLFLSTPASAQREVQWQVNAQKFPDDVSVFADVTDNQAYVPGLDASAFAISVDEYAGDMGGWIMNANQPTMRSGATGAQILIMIDVSRSYTGEFDKAKRMARAIAQRLRQSVDEVGVAVFPTGNGYSESRLIRPFTNNAAEVIKAIENIELMPKGDETGGRFCITLEEGLKYFPATVYNKYRAIVLITGGADKGEGKGSCVKDSYAAGKVPFFSMGFKLDKKYDDPRNSHKIENGLYDLALNTGGRSIFRRSESEMAYFIDRMLWNRIKNQYYLQISFPCYRQAPIIQHTSVLKVDGRDADGIQYSAASMPAPVPAITALYPSQAYRQHVDDGKIDLTIDGKGFCGGVQVSVGGAQVQVKSFSPYRITTSLNKAVDTGKVKVTNAFKETGESTMEFEIVKPPKGAEASRTLMFLIIGVVGLVVIAVLIVALKSRKAKVPAGAVPAASSVPSPSSPQQVGPQGAAAKTVAVGSFSLAWITKPDGSKIDLLPGPNLIGREVNCLIKIDVPGVSREHAKIELDPASKAVWAEDLGSTNGTFWGLEGATEAQIQKLSGRRRFATGESIWIGGQKLVVNIKDAAGDKKEG